jgi:translation initiation factor IF-3
MQKLRPRFVILNGGASVISNVVHQLNEEIRDKEIRLIGAAGEQLGIVSSDEALSIAEEQGLDLVKISPQAVPPVCKLMNYGKYRFELSKRAKEAKKNQHVVEIKEVRMSPGIDVGDLNTKLKNAQKFLSEGNRVKVSVRFRGREMAHTDIGRDLLNQFAQQCAEVATLDKSAKLEGRNMSIFLSPKAAK